MHDHNQHRCKPDNNKSDVKEVVKVAQIRDIYGNLRYEVLLRSFNKTIDEKENLVYEVQVVNFFGVNLPTVVAQQPENEELLLQDYYAALKIYNEYLSHYKHLVEAEVKNVQDISIYKDKIGYEITCPECCATCSWCKISPLRKHCHGFPNMLVCTNPYNMSSYDFDVKPTKHCYDHYDDKLIIHPNVEWFGLCRKYNKGREIKPILPNDVEG